MVLVGAGVADAESVILIVLSLLGVCAFETGAAAAAAEVRRRVVVLTVEWESDVWAKNRIRCFTCREVGGKLLRAFTPASGNAVDLATAIYVDYGNFKPWIIAMVIRDDC